MDIIFNFFPTEPIEAPKPQKPQLQLSPNDVRKLFENNRELFSDMVKMGYSEEDASKMVLAHGKKN